MFKLAVNKVRTFMYNLGDKGCGTRDTSQHFLGLFCSLGVDSEQYFELLKADEQVVWFFSWKPSVVIDISMNLFSSLL